MTESKSTRKAHYKKADELEILSPEFPGYVAGYGKMKEYTGITWAYVPYHNVQQREAGKGDIPFFFTVSNLQVVGSFAWTKRDKCRLLLRRVHAKVVEGNLHCMPELDMSGLESVVMFTLAYLTAQFKKTAMIHELVPVTIDFVGEAKSEFVREFLSRSKYLKSTTAALKKELALAILESAPNVCPLDFSQAQELPETVLRSIPCFEKLRHIIVEGHYSAIVHLQKQDHLFAREILILLMCLWDKLAWLSKPGDACQNVTGKDFKIWVHNYLRLTGHKCTLTAMDLYLLRCNWVHTYGATNTFKQGKSAHTFGFTNGHDPYFYLEDCTPPLLMMSLGGLIQQGKNAIENFLVHCACCIELQQRIELKVPCFPSIVVCPDE